jgi:hypothetical protein
LELRLMAATHRAFVGTFARDEAPQWERQSGVIGVYEAAPRPVWTAEAPTHPGAWHVRLPGDDRSIVVQVERDERGLLVWGLPRIDQQSVRGSDVQWSNRAVMEPIEP